MQERVHYYSPYDMSIPFNWRRADVVIENYKNGWRPQDVCDVVELYNIWQFVENDVAKEDWTEEMLQLIRSDFKKGVVGFFSALKRDTWVAVFRQLEYDYKRHFWAILDRFNIDGLLDLASIREAIEGSNWELRDLLRRERLVSKNQGTLVELLKENEHTAEWLLQEYVQKDTSGGEDRMYFPQSLSFQDKEDVISRYLDRDEPNLNYVRLVLVAKKDENLRLSDAVKLKASRVEKQLNEKHFSPEHAIQHTYAVSINSAPGKPLKWVEPGDGGDPVLCYSKEWMLRFRGPELLHYIRYGFEFLTQNGMVFLVSKDSDSGVFERAISMSGKFSYQTNFAFRYLEAISLLQITAMQQVLADEGTNIETSLKAFYEQFLKEKYGYPSGKLSLADSTADWVTKCKVIAPEIDAIAHRYDQYAKNGSVDEELLMISSDNVRVTEADSANPGRYFNIKGKPGELYRLFYLFFSDQSMLTFVEPFKENQYDSFYKLLSEQDGKIPYDNFQDYQLRDIDYLIEKGYLSKGDAGMLFVEKPMEISLLKQLYEYHSCPAHIYGEFEKGLLHEMEQKEWIEKDNHLLSVEERNYFDYYMYNTKYTNGPALRNRYAHGSFADPKKVNIHRNNYNRLLILLVLELLKIEEDLVNHQMVSSAKEQVESAGYGAVALSSIAEIGTYAYAQSKLDGTEYLKVPKKYGIQDGYVYHVSIESEDNFAYYIQPSKDVCAEYLSFLLNASLMRLNIAQTTPAPVSLNIEKLKSVSVPLVPYAEQRIYAKFEHTLAALVAKGETRNRDENLQYNVFSTLRDYLCLELLRPEFTEQRKLEFIKPFLELMRHLDGENGSIPAGILRAVFAPGSLLAENMKKARVILTDSEEN